MAIIKPEQMNFSNKNIIMIISGLPGVGKTTLALSAPDVVLIDADEGMARVKPEHRRDSSISKTYEELLIDIQDAEGRYKTVVIDTGGALVDMLKDWAIRTEPTAKKKGGGISLQGFGVVKTEFLRFFVEIRKKFNVVMLFHESKEKQDDTVFYDIVCEGSARTLVWQPADLGAHLHIINGERYLGFTPTMNYNAKSAYGIKGLVKVPELKDGDKNDFLTRLFEQVKQNLAAESANLKPQREAYDAAIKLGSEIIRLVDVPEKMMEAREQIKMLNHALTSHEELKSRLKDKARENGWVYDKEAKRYVAKAE